MAIVKEVKTTQVYDDVTQTVPTDTRVVVTQPTGVVPVVNSAQYRINQLVWFFLGLIEAIIALRFAFNLLGANSGGFTNLIRDLSQPFVYPFIGIFPSPSAGGAYFDSAAILAMIIWALVGWGIIALINILMAPRDRSM